MITDYFKPQERSRKQDFHKADTRSRKPIQTEANWKQHRRSRLREIAEETLSALSSGYYFVDGRQVDLTAPIDESISGTSFFEPEALIDWQTPEITRQVDCSITVEESTTLVAACELFDNRRESNIRKIGILNFASAKKEGGGFKSGAQAQEESIARSSTLYPSLMTSEGQRFYEHHRKDNNRCYYTHSMIYSRNIRVIRDDDARMAEWHLPVTVDVLTSPAVNAGVVLSRVKDKSQLDTEKARIREVMRERMARLLFLFENECADGIVLGSFGTGVFKNNVKEVANIWKLLLGPGGRFSRSFRQVTFAVIPSDVYEVYKELFAGLKVI